MAKSPEESRVGLGAGVKSFSCLACRQRKVKCDRHDPCSNCRRAASECSFVPPVRGKRKIRKTPKEGLHSKIKRYEELLRSYGADIELSDQGNSSDGETEADVEMVEAAESGKNSCSGLFAFDKTNTKLVNKNGSSRYFDSGLWSDLGDEFHQSEEETHVDSEDGATVQAYDPVDLPDEDGLLLSADSKPRSLASFHPPFHVLETLWQVYVERVDPLMKLLHLPTFWSQLTSAFQCLHNISKCLEAAMFAFYLATVCSLDEDECQSLLREQRSILVARYKRVARQALINAKFLNSSSLLTLQAFVLFLKGLRGNYQSDSLYILSGVAVRLGRRMGLHRDGEMLGLSLFETEMRRRLWWQIVHIDCRASDFSGTKPSMDLFLSDTKKPLNVEDEDLNPDMIKPPAERTGITSAVLCLVRCDIMEYLRKITPHSSCEVLWGRLSSSCITLAEKDNMIQQIKDHLERKYLRYCDPSIPLHYLSSILARSAICKMTLTAHDPRQFANRGVKTPQVQRDIIFANGTKLLEYANLIQSSQQLHKFMWQISTSYLWDTLFYVLIEARHRGTGPEVDKTWELIGGIFSSYPQIFAEATETLYAALGHWTLQVWDDCVAASKADGLPERPTPEYITAIRRCRRPSREPSFKSTFTTDLGKVLRRSLTSSDIQRLSNEENLFTDIEPPEVYDFSNLLSFDLEPNEWAQWERLLAGQEV